MSNAFIDNFKHMQSMVYKNAVEHGFWKDGGNNAEKIALMHSELSEALEGFRHENPKSEHIPEFSSVEEEYADVIIRIMDPSERLGLRIAQAIVAKANFNASRPYMHGKKF